MTPEGVTATVPSFTPQEIALASNCTHLVNNVCQTPPPHSGDTVLAYIVLSVLLSALLVVGLFGVISFIMKRNA